MSDDLLANILRHHVLTQEQFNDIHRHDEYDAYNDPLVDKSLCDLINRMNLAAPDALHTVYSCASHPEEEQDRFYIMFHITVEGAAVLFNWVQEFRKYQENIESLSLYAGFHAPLIFGDHLHNNDEDDGLTTIPCVVWEFTPIRNTRMKHQVIRLLGEIVDHSLSKTSTDNKVTRVYRICHAYESGFGHGYQQDGKENPYDPKNDSECHEAYQLGYAKGYEVKAAGN